MPFQEQEKVWEGLFRENCNRISERSLDGLSPRSALQSLLRLRLRRRPGVHPLQGSKQASNLQKKRRQVTSVGYSIFPSAKDGVQRMCKDRSVQPGIFVRCIVLFLSFFFDTVCCLFKGKERRFGEGLLGENYNRIAAGGLGGLSLRSALQRLLRLRLRRRLGLRPLQDSKQASKQLVLQKLKSLKRFIGSDLNEAVPNHPANLNDSQTSGYTTGSSSIASSFVLFFLLLPSVLKKMKNKVTSNMNIWRVSFHDPWTVIGALTTIGVGPVIVDHCVVK